MYLDKLVFYILLIIILFVVVTSIMTFIKVQSYEYTPYLYFCSLLFICDLIIVQEPEL